MIHVYRLNLLVRHQPRSFLCTAFRPIENHQFRLPKRRIYFTHVLSHPVPSHPIRLSNGRLEADRDNAIQGAGTRTVADVMGKSSLDEIEGLATPPEGTSNPLCETESARRWAATVDVPEITDQTIAIISRLISP